MDYIVNVGLCPLLVLPEISVLFILYLLSVSGNAAPFTPITPAARISALNIVGDLLRKLGVSTVLSDIFGI